ncbi:MAG: phosphatidylserine decarboxylase family protein [bacterium]|nr:phosphatidylserine decarboxylase family protein [bacterium]
MAKEGLGVIASITLLFLILLAGAVISGAWVLTIFAAISLILLPFTVYFFRDPDRTTPNGDNLIVSPADGKIIKIEEVEEEIFFKQKVRLISIFMSVLDVHVNRMPIDGRVTYFNYQRGKFHRAFKDDASYENEQTVIGIENPRTRLLFKQIAGIIARRIVCPVREGWKVQKGERFGMIKFGSRVDIFLPNNVNLLVKLNEHVKAGETIIGTY